MVAKPSRLRDCAYHTRDYGRGEVKVSDRIGNDGEDEGKRRFIAQGAVPPLAHIVVFAAVAEVDLLAAAVDEEIAVKDDVECAGALRQGTFLLRSFRNR